MLLGGTTIHCTQIGQLEKLRQIRIADDFKIPPRCLCRAHHIAKRHLEVSAKRRKDYYDMKSNLISIEPFDKVWFLNENRKEGCCQKLMPLYTGPYLVLQKFNDINYKMHLNGQGTIQVVNHDKLIPWKSSIIPRWMKLVEQKMSKKNLHNILIIVFLKMYVNKLKLKKKTKIKL